MLNTDAVYKLGGHENQNGILRKSAEIESCFIEYFHVDQKTSVSIMHFLKPLLNDEKYHPILDTFIEKIKRLYIQFSIISNIELLPDDAVLKAPQWHNILFENSHVRILRGVVKCDECVPFHIHQWERLMIVIQGGKFKSEDFQGAIEFDDIQIGVYESQGEKSPLTSTNIGNNVFEALVFEIKK